MFDTLPALEVSNIDTTQDVSDTDGSDPNDKLIELPLDNDTLFELQQKDTFCAHILAQKEKGNINEGKLYIIQNKLLKRYVTDGNKTYETIVLSRALTAQILKMAHDNLGHNGTHRTYMLLKRLYYWKGLKPSVTKHIQRCYQCQRRNKQVVKCYVSQWWLVLKFFECLGFWMCFNYLYGALSLHNCSSSGSLVFARLGRIN